MADAPPAERLFLGKHRPVLDSKHRITIPKAWRRGASETFYLSPSVDGSHLNVQPPEEFKKAYEVLNAATTFTRLEVRSFQRAYFSEVEPCDTDSQGRIILPEEFRQTAELEGELLLLGAFVNFEIWNPARWALARAAERATANRVGASQGL